MLKSYLLLNIRKLFRQRRYFLLNLAGMSIALCCCLYIFRYVSYEKSYDDFHPKAENLVRLRLDNYESGKLAFQSPLVYPTVGPALKKDYPEVVNFFRLLRANALFHNPSNNIKFSEHDGFFADNAVLSMLDIHIKAGNAKTALLDADQMIISESMAKKYFGNENPLGKTLLVKDPNLIQTYHVSGVFQDYPSNSHLAFNYLISYPTLGKYFQLRGDNTNSTETSWRWYNFYTYLELAKGVDWKNFEKKLPAFADRYINHKEEAKINNRRNDFFLMPVQDIHLHSSYDLEAKTNGDATTITIISIIGFLIMLIAWINYMNLSIARSIERSKEVGIRKVLGANRLQLIIQYLSESYIINILSFITALLLAWLLFPALNTFIGISVPNGQINFIYWFIFICLFLTGSFISGIYPALVLSRFKVTNILKGISTKSTSGLPLRKGLIVLQFSISVILMISTFIVFRQLKHMSSAKLEANLSNTLILEGAESLQDSVYQMAYQPFKTAITGQNGVKNITSSNNIFGKEFFWTVNARKFGTEPSPEATIQLIGIDEYFIPTYDVPVKAGRNFSGSFGDEQRAIILNELAVNKLGYKDSAEAVGKRIVSGNDTFRVVGVVANYHHEGVHKQIQPIMLRYMPNSRHFYSVKYNTADIQGLLSFLSATWNRYFPNDPFSYFFLEDFYDKQYNSYQLYGKVIGFFSIISILLSCFGLLGLSAISIIQRTREIGIRKVLGASVKNIVGLLSKDFLQLIALAILIAFPLSYIVMSQWLDNFPYRITISWWIFCIAGLLTIFISFVTVSFLVIKAALKNPVKTIRT